MSESLQERKHEMPQSGDIDNRIPIQLDNGCNPAVSQVEQQITPSGPLLDVKEDNNKVVEAGCNTPTAKEIPDQDCQQPVVVEDLSSQIKEDAIDQAQPQAPIIPTTTTTTTTIPTTTSGSVLLATVDTAATAFVTAVQDKPIVEKKNHKDDEKLGIYKALAIKLKKELVKTRDELAKLKDEYNNEAGQLRERVITLEKTLESERVIGANTNATLEATVKNLRDQLMVAEQDVQSLQIDFENYKTRATKILQQSQPMQSSSNKCFEEDRYQQLKSLCNEQKGQIKDLRAQIAALTLKNRELDTECKSLDERLKEATTSVEYHQTLEEERDRLMKENKSLKVALEHSKVRAQSKAEKRRKENKPLLQLNTSDSNLLAHGAELGKPDTSNRIESKQQMPPTDNSSSKNELDDDCVPRDSPTNSVKDDVQTNSSSSFDSSAYGYVHIKPTPFEIISRSSVLEDAQNQIDNITKAYLDSESTNSLLTEQVQALKEEIRRIQRGNERIELANNLEYLKNVMFKFLSLDTSQVEQKQRLIPVLSTILKLSPEETSKLNSLALVERGGMTSSFFKL